MANLVKSKIYLSASSLLFIVAMSALETNFFRTPVIKEWHKDSLLVWEDFTGIAPPLTGYDAAITSSVYLRYDSVQESYLAYAGQNNHRSWVKGSATTSGELLKHEQYHFNITALFARKLNDYIQTHPRVPYARLKQKLQEEKQKMYAMQERYDHATEHSLIQDLQRYWEFKIDSLLMNYEDGRGTLTDYFSGISGRFSHVPDRIVATDSFLLRTGFRLERYQMRFRFMTRYDACYDSSAMEKDFVAFLDRSGFINIESTPSDWHENFLFETACEDTVNKKVFYDRIYYQYPYHYQVTVCVPLEYHGNFYFNRMKTSFFNSITINSKVEYWKEMYKKNPQKMRALTTDKTKAAGDFVSLCAPNHSDYSIVYHAPFSYQDAVLIPFSSQKHTFEEIKDVLIVINDEAVLRQEPDSVYQIVAIDKHLLDPGKNTIQFGYSIKADSAAGCYHFYSSLVGYKYQGQQEPRMF